jgi:mono/diheme cytochrome c family protein
MRGIDHRTSRRARLLAAITITLLAAARAAHAADSPDQDIKRTLYLRYCGACHGPEGKGDGIAAQYMTPRPTDLTQIMKKHDNTYPFKETMQIIDGTNNVRAHGSPDMPVWGEVWHEQSGISPNERAETRGKTMLITEYIFTLQERAPVVLNFVPPKAK